MWAILENKQTKIKTKQKKKALMITLNILSFLIINGRASSWKKIKRKFPPSLFPASMAQKQRLKG